jgi:hypothetical protein
MPSPKSGASPSGGSQVAVDYDVVLEGLGSDTAMVLQAVSEVMARVRRWVREAVQVLPLVVVQRATLEDAEGIRSGLDSAGADAVVRPAPPIPRFEEPRPEHWYPW